MQKYILSVSDVMHGVALSVCSVTGAYTDSGESPCSLEHHECRATPKSVDTAKFFEFLNAHFALAPITDDLLQRRICIDFIRQAQDCFENASAIESELPGDHLMAAAVSDGSTPFGFIYQSMERPELWGFVQGDCGCAEGHDFVRDVLEPIFRFHGVTAHDIATQNGNLALYQKLCLSGS